MSGSDRDRDRDRNRTTFEVRDEPIPSFVDVESERSGVAVVVTIDEEAFREAVRREIHAELERQLRNPRESEILELVGKFVESWLSRRSRRRHSD